MKLYKYFEFDLLISEVQNTQVISLTFFQRRSTPKTPHASNKGFKLYSATCLFLSTKV